MNPDRDFADACATAERIHDESGCKCGTKVKLSGRDGPSLYLLLAAFDVASALATETRLRAALLSDKKSVAEKTASRR